MKVPEKEEEGEEGGGGGGREAENGSCTSKREERSGFSSETRSVSIKKMRITKASDTLPPLSMQLFPPNILD